jgi:hypothetical protein
MLLVRPDKKPSSVVVIVLFVTLPLLFVTITRLGTWPATLNLESSCPCTPDVTPDNRPSSTSVVADASKRPFVPVTITHPLENPLTKTSEDCNIRFPVLAYKYKASLGAMNTPVFPLGPMRDIVVP